MCCCSRKTCCNCCSCFDAILATFQCACCNKYFPGVITNYPHEFIDKYVNVLFLYLLHKPTSQLLDDIVLITLEWQITSSWWIWAVKTVLILLLGTAAWIFCFMLSEPLFATSTITLASALLLAAFMIYTAFLVVVYGPYLLRAYPIWLSILITIIYLGGALYLIIEDLIRGNLDQFETDSVLFDIWTVIHFLAGPQLALVLPFVWMFIILSGWEVFEAFTVGFGETETIGNRIVDVGVGVIGWWILILIFKKTRTDIPWISSMNAAGNNGEPIDWGLLWNKITCGCCCRAEEGRLAESNKYGSSYDGTENEMAAV